jgi:GDPmannose 4,6-dehydratase
MFTHTGPRRGDVFAESSFAKQIAMKEVGQLSGPIQVGNLNAVRTIADVRDAVRAYHMLLTVNPQAGAVYNIGGTHTCTISQVLDILFEVAGQRYEVEVDPERLRPIDADHQVPDCSAFMEHTGWKPEISFEQTMADLLKYWREKVKHRRLLQR